MPVPLPPAVRRIGWLIAIWALSVSALGLIAFAIRLVLVG